MGKQILLLVVLVFSGVASQAGGDVPFYETSYSSDVTFDDGINYESFVQGITTQNAVTLEQALELVPRDFYKNYVLVYRSRSLQDSNPLFPRAIVFGKSARFIMAFNGHKKQKGYNALEIIQFREKAHRWEFREILFQEGKVPTFSEANPKKCLECHQSPKRTNVDPRPNWEPYNFWPGVYASVDDELKPVLKEQYEKDLENKVAKSHGILGRFLKQDMVLIDEQSQEEKNLNQFISKIKPNHARYKHLGEFKTRDPLNLTKSTVILNMRRVARLMREELGELFDVYKYSLLGLGDGLGAKSSEMLKYSCADLYMPDSVRQKHLDIATQKREIPPSEYTPTNPPYGWSHGLSAGIDIVFLPLGIQTDDWSMDFRTEGRFSFEDRFTSPHHSATHLRDASMIVYQGDPALQLGCEELKREGVKALSKFEAEGQLDRAILKSQLGEDHKPTKPLVQRCIACHVNYEDGGQAPAIPFDDFQKLKPLLSVPQKYPRGTLYEEILYRISDHAPLREQMPPAGIPERRQRDEFIESLEKLKL